MRGLAASFTASAAQMGYPRGWAASPRTDRIRDLPVRWRGTDSKSPGEAIGNPASMTSTPRSREGPGHLELLAHIHAATGALLAVTESRIDRARGSGRSLQPLPSSHRTKTALELSSVPGRRSSPLSSQPTMNVSLAWNDRRSRSPSISEAWRNLNENINPSYQFKVYPVSRTRSTARRNRGPGLAADVKKTTYFRVEARLRQARINRVAGPDRARPIVRPERLPEGDIRQWRAVECTDLILIWIIAHMPIGPHNRGSVRVRTARMVTIHGPIGNDGIHLRIVDRARKMVVRTGRLGQFV